jgi:putative aldouronate transport system substrate-binding protein
VYPSPFLRFSSNDNQDLALVEANLSAIKSSWARWLSGDGDINREWESYIKAGNDAGLQRSILIRQNAFDTYLQTLK